MTRAAVVALTFIAALAADARADRAAEVLGAEYVAAAPADKLARLSVALAEKTLESRDQRPAIEEVVRGVVAPGETPEARLRLFGQLRTDAQALLTTRNTAARAAGGRAVSFSEPDGDTQLALALDYVATVAGDQPTLTELRCLKLVRESTTWSATTKLVLSFLVEALDRDATYAAADLETRLTTIRTLAVDHAMMSDHERTVIENALLAEHISGALAGGEAPAAILARLTGWKQRNLMCFFTYSHNEGIVKRLGELRAARTP